MDSFRFHDGNISNLIDHRNFDLRNDINHKLHMHSSMVQRLSLERELEGHLGCVNTISWNSSGSLLISGSDDTRINIWRYSDRKLLNCIDTGHSSNIFCTKFVPETSDEIVASGAGDAEVRVFNISRLSGSRAAETSIVTPSAHFQCHTRRVKKLAVEVGNPNVIWSASEDGTMRQHDLREGCSCPPAGASNQECRNVLLDLRGAAKKSLAEPPKQPLQIKSCDISTTRPHLLLVGGSDAFARLYDRRMLPPLSTCRRKISPPPCVNYFCPMHLSERGRSSLHLTHVTFSPNGEEVLVSYSGEHVYLMDVNQGSGCVQYTSGDVARLSSFSPILNDVNLSHIGAATHDKNSIAQDSATVQLDKCRKLVKLAENCLHEGSNYYHGIEVCNEVLDGGYKLDRILKHDCLCVRAALLLKRKWKNDAHIALKDLNLARRIDSSSLKALLYMSQAFSQVGKHKEALDFAIAAKCLDPSSDEVAERVESIQKQLSAAEDEKNKPTDGGPKSEPRAGRVISLSDILYRSEANSDASQDGARSEREDSDYDEELELDFETSVSGDEAHDADSNVLHGSVNLRIHRRPESAREATGSNGSCGSPSFSNQNDKASYQPETVIDMKQRYIGHCNVGTDIKQASFLGQNGNYVASGSDDGRWFIWEKKTGRLIKMLLGDEAVVNCIQCHPFDSVVATSGIDSTIKIWTPTAPVPSMVAGGSAGPDTAKFLEAMEGNQQRLCRTREAILPFELLERFRMHDFTEGTMHPFECAQT